MATETLVDGFYGMEGGMNSALSPHLIDKSQYHVGFNLTSRGGQVGPRPGFRHISTPINFYRGGVVYTHRDGTYSFINVAGNSIRSGNVGSTSATFSQVSTMSSTSGAVYFCIVESYVVIQDGANLPKVLKASSSASGAWTDVTSTYGNNIPIGTHMAYGHGRIFVTASAGAIAPVCEVNLTPSSLVCSILNGGGGYNSGQTNTYTGASIASLKIYPEISYDGGTWSTPSGFTLVITNGLLTSLTITGTYTKIPTIRISTNDQSGNRVTTGSRGNGAEVSATLSPTSVASITIKTQGSGYTLTPTVTFDSTGTGGTGAKASSSRSGDTLTLSVTSSGSGYKRPPRLVISNMGGNSQEIVASDISYGGSASYLDIETSFATTNGTAVVLSEDVPFLAGEAVTIEAHSSFPLVDGTWSVSNVGDRPSDKRGIKAILLDDEGSGYKSAPTVLIDAPPEGGRKAKAKAIIGQTISSVSVSAKTRGANYDPDATNTGDDIQILLLDDWPTTGTNAVELPRIEARLGEGATSEDKVAEDKVKVFVVEDGGGPYVKGTTGRLGFYNNVTNAWEWQKTKAGAEIVKALPLPPRLKILNTTAAGASVFKKSGTNTVPYTVTKKGRTYYTYPKGWAHAVPIATVSAVVTEIQITDSGAGYREAPNVELVGGLGKNATAGFARAVLDDTTVRDPKVFTIPAVVSTVGVGGRVRRANAGKFEDIFNFTENTYLAEGGGFSTAGFTGKITGMFFLPVANTTTGRGDLVVLGEKGAVSMAVSNPRSEWKDMAFIRVILSETGAVSDNAYIVAQGDVFFYSREGLRTYRNAKTGEIDGSVLPLDTELYGVLGANQQTSSRLAYCDNRVFFLVSPTATGHKAMGVLDWTSSYAGRETARPAWDGFWTAPGENLNGTVSNTFLDLFSVGNSLLAVCTNGVFKLDTSLVGDALTSNASSITAINWILETRGVDFDAPSNLKRLLRASVWIQDASGANTFSLLWRTENRPNWTPWVTNQQYTSSATRYAYRMDLPVPGADTTTQTDAEMGVGTDRGQNFQFRVEGSGKLRFVKFMFYAIPVVESQYGVVQTSTVSIVPTGTAETYPI